MVAQMVSYIICATISHIFRKDECVRDGRTRSMVDGGMHRQ